MINPFQCPNQTDLLNIATGEKAPFTDLIHARSRGLEAIRKAEEQNISAIESPRLQTFVQTKKSKPSKTQNLVQIYKEESSVTRVSFLVAEAGKHLLQPPSLPESELSTVFLIDAMAFVNRFQSLGAKTFGDLLDQYVEKILQLKPRSSKCVNVVGDRYDVDDAHSLKGDERLLRNQTEHAREFCVASSLEVPDWKLLMQNPKNKKTCWTSSTALW